MQTRRGVVHRAGGRTARKVTAYLPLALAQRLQRRAVDVGRPMSELVTDAVQAMLVTATRTP